MLSVGTFTVADGNLLDGSVLTEEFGPSQSLKQLVFPDSRCQPGDINQVFLDDPHANKVLAVLLFGFALLNFFMPLLLRSLLLIFLDIGTKLGNPISALLAF